MAEDADWIDETVTKLRQLVTIRRTTGVSDAESLDGRLVAAHEALAGGELAQAIVLIEELGPTAAAGAEEWLQDARNRREVDTAIDDITRVVAARVGARWSDASPTP